MADDTFSERLHSSRRGSRLIQNELRNRIDIKQGLVVFDLDGTLLRGQTVCEVLALPLGHMDEMKQFEALTLESDITKARTTMATWYSSHTTTQLLGYLPNAQWAKNTLTSITRLQAHGLEVAIASITWKFAVGWFAEQLKIRHYLGTDLLPSGEIIHVWGRHKASWMSNLAGKYNIPTTRLAAVGDSSGDIEMLRSATLRFFVGKVPPENIDNIIHLPDAVLEVIADQMISMWGLQE